MASLLRSLRALSDSTRLRLLLLLSREELTVAELQDILGMGQSRISASLGLLRREGLVTARRAGKNTFYSSRGALGGTLSRLAEDLRAEMPEAVRDQTGLEIILRRRKDKAAAYFDRLAGRFGRSYVPGRSWRALAHGLLVLLPKMVIADLGAGEGTLSRLLAKGAEKVIAVDSSPKMVEVGAREAEREGFRNLEFRLGDIEDPPIDPESVDLALFSQALHHAASPSRAVAAAWRILRPGGRILVLDLSKHTLEEARELYADNWLGFTEAELAGFLEDAGFGEIHTAIVAREARAPHFQTILATGRKNPGLDAAPAAAESAAP